jgi:peptide subunit release factor 1 (eRF1)
MLPLEKAVDELQTFDGGGAPVLSLYLSTDPSTGSGMNLPAQLTGLLRSVAGHDRSEQQALDAEAQIVRDYLRSLDGKPRGLALFVCAAHSFLRAVHLPVRVKPEARRGARPDVLQLLALMDEHEPVIILLADQREAHFYRIFLDDIELLQTLTAAPAPGRTPSRNDPEMEAQSRQQEGLRTHMRTAVELLSRLVIEQGADRILFGGTPDTTAELQRQLPTTLRDRACGPVGLAVNATPAEILQRVRQRLEAEERGAELLLLDRVRERTGSGRAAMGPGDVIEAVMGGAVSCLVYAAGARTEGAVCAACETLYPAPAPRMCAVCGGTVQPSDDLVEQLVARTLTAGGRIEEVRGDAAAQLEECGGVAALLRYAVQSRVQIAGGR